MNIFFKKIEELLNYEINSNTTRLLSSFFFDICFGYFLIWIKLVNIYPKDHSIFFISLEIHLLRYSCLLNSTVIVVIM